MRKLRLTLDDLRIDTFATERAEGEQGTVRGREWTENTDCWGLCGESGAFGCGGDSSRCTYDPQAISCMSYATPCPPTAYPNNNTCFDTCVTPDGYTMCGSEC